MDAANALLSHTSSAPRRLTLGVLAGWQYYWTATPLSYIAPLFRAIRLAAHDLGCNLLLGCGMGPSSASGDPFRPAWPALSADSDFVPIGPWNTDGLLIVNPLHSAARSHYVRELVASRHPVLFVASGEEGPTIVADNASGTMDAVGHLVQHGHRRIAFIAGSPDDLGGDSGARLRAYQTALRVHALEIDDRLVEYGRHLFDEGYAAMRRIIAAGAPFSAVLASNDESAMGAMQALREANLRIPQDVAVIGFDDRPENVVQDPALSSVHVPLFEIGYHAVELLLRQIHGHGIPAGAIRVPTRLMVRESCGCGQGVHAAAATAAMAAPPRDGATAQATVQSQLTEAMAAAVLAEAQESNSGAVKAMCRRLVAAFTTSVQEGDRALFRQTLDDVLTQVAASHEDTHLWQAAMSVLRDELPRLVDAAAQDRACAWLDSARLAISATMWRQHRLYIVNERSTRDRVSMLTARLLNALDEAHAYRILAQDLPQIGIQVAAVSLLESGEDGPATWTVMQRIVPWQETTIRFRSQEYPPGGFLVQDQPLSLALVPLTGPRGQLGYVTFDTAAPELYGTIVQQLAAALTSAQLYREATEGRRLAEEANQLKSRFLSMVSHELRTPLSLIVGLSGMLLNDRDQAATPLPQSIRKDVESILANAQHLGWLINDVLDLASSEAGHLRLARELVDLSDALRVVAETGRELAAGKGLAWHETLPETGPWVWGDRTRLRQVTLNLVHNAVKFTTAGEVRLGLIVSPESVTVEVRDTGLGIPPAEQDMIFDEFGRSQRSVSRGYGGLGLGLAICKRLVEMHEGTIGVRSTGQEGTGSTFYFTLPTVAAPDYVAELAARPAAADSVLVLTAQGDRGEPIRQHLSQRGIHVVVMQATSEWLDRVALMAPNAIVLDKALASEHGWQIFQALHGNLATRAIPVLFYSQTDKGAALFELDYLSKPVSPAELVHIVDQRLPVQDARNGAHTILVVDDAADTVEMHVRIVQAHSPLCQILKARNGREALDILQRERVHLVLLDLLMPEMDGFAVLEAMREAETMRDVPVIVLTGQVLSEGDMARLNRGVATVLAKGLFTLDETLAHVNAALERQRKLSDEARRLVRKAMAYVHQHYAEPISRRDLAQHVAMDDDYLTFCFRKEVGVTPVAYLNRCRVNQARLLLVETQKSITEIALDVGFSDSGYFSRVFHREVGQSPEAYRTHSAVSAQ